MGRCLTFEVFLSNRTFEGILVVGVTQSLDFHYYVRVLGEGRDSVPFHIKELRRVSRWVTLLKSNRIFIFRVLYCVVVNSGR